MATTTEYYKIFDGGFITITNTKEVIGTGKDAYTRELIKHGTDDKIETPDAGRITKFGPVQFDEIKDPETGEVVEIIECIHIPAAYAAIRLPLYRAGAGTTVIIEAGAHIFITPTLSEEVVYYKDACEKLGLTFAYDDGQD